MLIPSYSAFLRFSDFAWRATECDDSGVTLTIWRNAPETERRDCGISEEEIERTCSMYDDCNECPLWDYCNEDEEVL